MGVSRSTNGDALPAPTTIYTARRIHPVDGRDRPDGSQPTALAVRGGRVLAVGSLDECRQWGEAVIDDRFGDDVIVPGFVEAHAHVGEGAIGTSVPVVSRFDRPTADGGMSPAVRSYGELIERLRSLDRDMDARGEPDTLDISVRGFDPIYYAGERRLDRHHLDAVQTRRPIYVQHANGHLATVNTRGLEVWDITDDLAVEGLGRFDDGSLSGELREGAQTLARGARGGFIQQHTDPQVIRWFAAAAQRAGITTCSDIVSPVGLVPGAEEVWASVTREETFPIRAASFMMAAAHTTSIDDFVESFRATKARNEHSRWLIPAVKIVFDGSIQGWTAAISEPGYFTGTGHPMLLIPIEKMREIITGLHRAHITVHVHCNGDLASEAVLDLIEEALSHTAWLDHRHTITHAQTMTRAQLRRAARLGVAANFFTNHLWYWGDQHYEQTLGPDRANNLDPCGDALLEGVPFSLHCDAPVTPLSQLHTMWCAVNRVTPSGRVLGPWQCITPSQALRAVTIDAAWMMRLDHEVGSLETGKRADFTVLDADPLSVDPMAIRNIGVLGTVIDGVPTVVS